MEEPEGNERMGTGAAPEAEDDAAHEHETPMPDKGAEESTPANVHENEQEEALVQDRRAEHENDKSIMQVLTNNDASAGGSANAASDAGKGAEQTTGVDDFKQPNKTTSSHIRTTSKVEVIEAPARGTIVPSRYIVGESQPTSNPSDHSPSPLRPDLAQHRHDSRLDQPSSYQPSTPRTYFQLRAMALQLPNVTNNAPNASHIDPPTIIMEGRTNLSSARRSFYPKVTRTLPELHLWLLALTLSFPASIFSPFTYPLIALTNGGSPSDAAIRNYLVTITNQLGRILIKPYVLSHPATVALVDCDFNYTPTLPHIGPGSSPLARRKMDEGLCIARAGFDPFKGRKGKGGSNLTTNGVTSTWDVDGVAAALGLPTAVYAANHDSTSSSSSSSSSSKNPLSIFSSFNASPQRIQQPPPIALPPGEEDEDEEDLTLARNEITRLEMQFEKASRAAEIVVEKGGSLNATLNQLTQALGNLERLDSGRLIAKRSHEDEIVGAMIKGIEGWSAAEAGASSTILSTITPSMAYQSLNARMAIDALLRRASAATHRHSALVVLVQKRREAERLKRARGEIRQEEVDWVLNELREAQRTTQVLTNHLATFTATLKEELKSHSRFTHTDVQANLVSHARNSIRAHKFMLNSLSKARDDLLARREGKVVGEVHKSHFGPIAGEMSHGPMPIESVMEEEHPQVYSAPVDNGDAEQTGAAMLNGQAHSSIPDLSSRSDVAEGITVPNAVSIADSAKREEKALPVVPAGDDVAVEQAGQKSERGEQEVGVVAIGQESANIRSQARTSKEEGATSTSFSSPTVPDTIQESTWSEDTHPGVAQSGFLPSSTAHDSKDEVPAMAQSAFLPGRSMERYANPFARLDPNLASSTFPVQNVPSSSPQKGKTKTNDVWASRSRLSASDAARSLAGRF
ncbi:hypothetical protein CBS101457_000990 [Exobasidium rhododendri]|nr:hypothetical protein CBS101457_000990 [Exobasidium rhododendri]